MRQNEDIMRKSGKNPPPKPDKPCYVCGSNDWWLRDDEWLCNRCHPEPKGKAS